MLKASKMSAFSKRYLVAVLLAVPIGVVLAALAIRHDGANAATQSELRMSSTYRAPTGPEMTPQEATDSVVERFGRKDGKVLGEMTAITAHSNFAQAWAVVNGKKPAEAEYGGPADIAEWRTSPSYLVVMRASAGQGFSPNVPVPPGYESPTASVMSMIVDAHTGQKESLNLEHSPPAHLYELGAAMVSVIPPTDATAAAHIPLGNLGDIVGRLYSNNRPAIRGWHVIVKRRRRLVARSRTYTHGSFSFRMVPGTYVVAGQKPSGKLCGARNVTVTRAHESQITLSCK
jgi:hypothetical protein